MSDQKKWLASNAGGAGYPGFRFANLKDGIRGRVLDAQIRETEVMGRPGERVEKFCIVVEAEKVRGTYSFVDSETGKKSTPPAEVGGVYAVWIAPRSLGASALNDACKAANVDEIGVGDTFSMAYIDDKDTGKGNPAKVYRCELVPAKPSLKVGGSLFGDEDDDTPTDDPF